ncbi:MAG: diadenylate cyclase CdaA [candidate division Zixibacteria bacterium]|nr:diadenylate cyclase CdaA [candidate division Zixibacteria bacterium]
MELFTLDFIKFRLTDVFDISIVSYILYKLLTLMKGTRSAQIVTGLTLVFTMAIVAFWFELEGLMFLFTNLATVSIIILVIIFQPELRGMLAQMGHSRVFRMLTKYEGTKTIDEVSRASIRLAELKYGGLLVIERSVGLKNFIETGKALNAQLSAEIITTLFTPYTPLHDGAVIVSGDYISAAACTLPLTKNPRYRKLYGMRHKAAIGVSEESDAIVIVVSEETGEVSIAYQGLLNRNIDRNELRDTIAGYFKK